MGRYQGYRGNPETKLFYLVDQLVGGINTDFSDDTSPDNEFYSIVNFSMDKRGSLFKRMGFGKLNAISEIFNLFDEIPTTKGKTPEDPNPETTNDNIVYMKMLKNDNNCFRNLSAFSGEKAYRKYQAIYGGQNNEFKLLMITTSDYLSKSTAWLFDCKLPPLEYDDEGNPTDTDTIVVTSQVYDLPVLFKWDRNLCNIDTIEFFDKIYFTDNDKGLVCFDRSDDTFSYSGTGITGQTNNAYKPSPMEVRKVGFNVLGDDPLHWVDYKGLTTDSIQGIYLTADGNIPLTVVPSGGKFRLNILYTGESSDFEITYKEGETELTATETVNTELSTTGLKVYDVVFQTVPTSEVEIKITKTSTTLEPYYDYYTVGTVDPETKAVSSLNIGDYGMCEMYNRAVYYKNDTIWFSEINNFNYIPNYNYVSLPIEPTDKITKIVFFKNVYIVFTKQRIYKMINAFGSGSFQVMPVNLSIGCHAPNTVIPIENELYFASPRGLYALRSSEYREGIENLRELDTKCKQLTSDVTMYLGEQTDPAVRYNGISERAYAIRYKDKYMMFFNTAFQQGDLAALVNLDVLVYQYDLKAFSEIKFPIKPTFLFMVDGAIETFCTVKEKEDYTVAETVLEYNFETDSGANRKITDLSGNGNDANMVGGAILAPGTGVIISGDNSYVKTGIIDSLNNLEGGFSVKLNCQISTLNVARLYDLKQATKTGQAEPQNFSIITPYSHGYFALMDFHTIPNAETMTNTINWTLKYYRESVVVDNSSSGTFSLTDSEGNYLINKTDFTFDMGDDFYVYIDSGTFTVDHDPISGSYSDEWTLNVASKYSTTTTGWNNGTDTSFDVTQNSSWSSYYGIRIKGTAKAFDGGCTVTYTPYIHLGAYGSLYNASQPTYVWINGVKHTHTTPPISTEGNVDISCGQQSQNITYAGTSLEGNNSPKVFVDALYKIRATIGGVYREDVAIQGFNINLPYSISYEEKTYHDFTLTGQEQVNLNQILKPSYKSIAIETTTDEHQLNVICNSEYKESTVLISNSDLDVTGSHEWKVDYVISTDGYTVNVYQDDVLFGSAEFDTNCIKNANRDNSQICYNLVGSLSSFDLVLQDNTKVISYIFDDGQGTTVTDKSGNGLNGSLNGDITWTVENGLRFDGVSGYLALPELGDELRFSNGFSIEFEAKFDNIHKSCKVIDLATSYDTTNSAKCGINSGIQAYIDKLNFNVTSIDNKSYHLSKNNSDLTGKHKWKFSVVDNGKDYDVSLYCDDVECKTTKYNYGGITNIVRKSNFIGKSNNPSDSLFTGMLYNLKITINASANPVPIYVGAMYEYDTTYDDFGRAMELELQTKGINLQYPMHLKKLKNIFVKGLGGFNYNNFYFEVYSDGHIVNNPKEFNCYIDEVTKQVVYDYTENKELSFNEMISLLGNMRLDNTKMGASSYETRKLIIPCAGKNFTVVMRGESSDFLGIESIGFTFKLGKVRDE